MEFKSVNVTMLDSLFPGYKKSNGHLNLGLTFINLKKSSLPIIDDFYSGHYLIKCIKNNFYGLETYNVWPKNFEVWWRKSQMSGRSR
jgi:hypothetical protein